jgi:hypothetical protein
MCSALCVFKEPYATGTHLIAFALCLPIDGALSFSELRSRLSELAKSQEIIFYCA